MRFSDLGVSFPLFDAPIDDASSYIGPGKCSLCGCDARVRFVLGIGDDIMLPCPSCRHSNGLDVDDKKSVACWSCNAEIPFEPIGEEELACCSTCLLNGRVAMTKDTELGMVTWEQVRDGMTHGGPGLRRTDFEMVPTESDWVRARVDSSILQLLVRTPNYSSIQGESWQFCCRIPMTFIGAWSREEFSSRAPDGNGSAFLDKIIGEHVPGLWEDDFHDVTGIYVFQCRVCNVLRGHWDLA